MAVRDELKQRGGVVHGGVYGAIAEGLAVRGTAASVAPLGKLAHGALLCAARAANQGLGTPCTLLCVNGS